MKKLLTVAALLIATPTFAGSLDPVLPHASIVAVRQLNSFAVVPKPKPLRAAHFDYRRTLRTMGFLVSAAVLLASAARFNL